MMKLKAFTLVETVVVIAITGILVFFCVFTYLILKTHEKNFAAKTSGAEAIAMATNTMTGMAYKANIIKWETPFIVFENEGVLGKVEVEDDSIAILNKQGDLFIKIGAKEFSYEPVYMKGGQVLIKSMALTLDQIKSPLVYSKKYAADVNLNGAIEWEN